MRFSVIIPAYNEAATVGEAVAAVRRELPGAEVVVVDDGSHDGTGAAASGADLLIRHQQNRGKAAAIISGLKASTGDIIALVDADMAHQAGEVGRLVRAVAAGEGDMSVAVFAASKGGGMGLVRSLASWGIRLSTGRKLVAPLSGQRAARRGLLEECLPQRGGYGLETELSIRALRRGYSVMEIPTSFVHHGHGWTTRGFRHRGRQFWHVLLALLRGVFVR